ncbi:MAG TPA: hypothetical protein VH988_26570 [Thermoanaerobaculia bacterium]|jgi:hypothetical protein|nr:hypothetical protein [Thermoanaerobaculia bacterium]
MARKLRFIPDPPTLVSIICRTVQGRFLFKPGTAFNDHFLGILGRAQRRHNLILIVASVLSNHFHILAVPENARQDIETEAALARSLQGEPLLGVEAILAKDPQHRPASIARSPAPLVHAATKVVRKAFYDAYAWFVSAFRQAAEKLRQGDRNASFPSGSFPPALPFVAG